MVIQPHLICGMAMNGPLVLLEMHPSTSIFQDQIQLWELVQKFRKEWLFGIRSLEKLNKPNQDLYLINFIK